MTTSLFFRLRRICHSTEDYIDKAIDMKESAKKQKTFAVTCSTRHSVHSSAIRSFFKKHWHILKSDPELSSNFGDPPLFVTKRGGNIRFHLVCANSEYKIRSNQEIQTRLHPLPKGNYHCGSCTQCNNTIKMHHFSQPHTGKTLPINSVIICASTNVIHMIRCPCGLSYVEKTIRKLKQRISEHKSTIHRNDQLYPIAVHFSDAHRDIASLWFRGNRSPYHSGAVTVIGSKGT